MAKHDPFLGLFNKDQAVQAGFLRAFASTPPARGQFVDIGGGLRAFLGPTADEAIAPLVRGAAGAVSAKADLAREQRQQDRQLNQIQKQFNLRKSLKELELKASFRKDSLKRKRIVVNEISLRDPTGLEAEIARGSSQAVADLTLDNLRAGDTRAQRGIAISSAERDIATGKRLEAAAARAVTSEDLGERKFKFTKEQAARAEKARAASFKIREGQFTLSKERAVRQALIDNPTLGRALKDARKGELDTAILKHGNDAQRKLLRDSINAAQSILRGEGTLTPQLNSSETDALAIEIAKLSDDELKNADPEEIARRLLGEELDAADRAIQKALKSRPVTKPGSVFESLEIE